MSENNKSVHSLYSFAYCGTDHGFDTMLSYLAKIAEPEIWSFKSDPAGKLSILRYYIFHTFTQCHLQGKILYSLDRKWCCINTGLMTSNGKEILMLFNENQKSGENKAKWFLKGFKSCVERDYMDLFSGIPDLASYTDDFNDFYFNPDFKIEINTDHILDDNWGRISNEIGLDKSVVKVLLTGIVEITQKSVRRNMRLAVPQYYKDEIMYLLPLQIPVSDNKTVTMALAIEKTSTNQYRANTIFTREMAYEKARLLMKPESNWLIENEKREANDASRPD